MRDSLGRCLSRCTALLLLGAASATGAEFVPGDLYLFSHALPGPEGTSLYGIVRVEPLSGTTTLLYSSTVPLWVPFTYDPYRRLLVFAHSDGRLLGVDADGAVSELLTPPSAPNALAARGDGILYMQVGAVFHYVDAANVQHPLLDQTGAGAYNFLPGGTVTELRYHAGTNSLIALSVGNSVPACSLTGQICATKIPLTAAGTQVAAAAIGVQTNISDSGEVAVGSGERSDGMVLLVYDTNSNDQEMRMQLLDPTTMTLGGFAASGSYTGAAALSTGTYSNVRGQAVLDDSFNDVLRAYSFGGAGLGTVFSSSSTGYGVSSGGHSEAARMVEIIASATPAPPARSGAILQLDAPQPNPQGERAMFVFRLARTQNVRVEVFDMRGRLVRTIFQGSRFAGVHTESWDGQGERGPAPSGVYFVRVSTASECREQRFVRIR
jgi:hypothetical protein